MSLLPGWGERLDRLGSASAPVAPRVLITRLDLERAASETRQIRSGAAAEGFLHDLRSLDLSALALAERHGQAREAVVLRNGRTWSDIRSRQVTRISIAACAAGGVILRAVLDVGVPEVTPVLGQILRLRTTFVVHDVKNLLFSLWTIGLEPAFHALYDTYLAATALHLGHDHKRAQARQRADEHERIDREREAEQRRADRLALTGQCAHYGLAYPFSDSSVEGAQASAGLFEGLDAGSRMAADAEWTMRLYFAQQPDVLRQGISAHLHTVEFPFALANTRMEWRGVHVDRQRLVLLREGAARAAVHYAEELHRAGIDPPGSADAFLDVMATRGLREHFLRDGHPTTEDSVLEAAEGLDPVIRAFRLHRRYSRLASEEWLRGALVGSDGRIHPRHQQLGAATGRNTCSTPNLVGIGRVFRPVVTAPRGRAILELDYGQIEIAVAAAEFDDPDLLAAYNAGDVYSAMAQRFYAAELSAAERQLRAREFKARRPELRERMKTFVLAVLYNIQAEGLALRFGISVARAEEERTRFLDLFPALRRGLEESSEYGMARGHAVVVSGLRRHVDRGGSSSWTRNFLRNTPIQGSAAVVFKRAMVELDRAFLGTATWLILPVHDAVVIECDQADVERVKEHARRIMEDALRAFYPAVTPKVDVNVRHPGCWNKDGHADSLEKFLADPTFTLDRAVGPSVAGEAESMTDPTERTAVARSASDAFDDGDRQLCHGDWDRGFRDESVVPEFSCVADDQDSRSFGSDRDWSVEDRGCVVSAAQVREHLDALAAAGGGGGDHHA